MLALFLSACSVRKLNFNEYLFPFCGNHAITHCDTLTHVLSRCALFLCFNQILFLPHNSFGRIDCLTMSSSSEGIILLAGEGIGRDAPKLLKRAIRTRLKIFCWK